MDEILHTPSSRSSHSIYQLGDQKSFYFLSRKQKCHSKFHTPPHSLGISPLQESPVASCVLLEAAKNRMQCAHVFQLRWREAAQIHIRTMYLITQSLTNIPAAPQTSSSGWKMSAVELRNDTLLHTAVVFILDTYLRLKSSVERRDVPTVDNIKSYTASLQHSRDQPTKAKSTYLRAMTTVHKKICTPPWALDAPLKDFGYFTHPNRCFAAGRENTFIMA